MPTYRVTLWTFDGRTRVIASITALDEMRAAAAAVPYFVQLGEDVASAISIDVQPAIGAIDPGRIRIGKGSSIGGNVWLTHDVPAGSQITQARARGESNHESNDTLETLFEES